MLSSKQNPRVTFFLSPHKRFIPPPPSALPARICQRKTLYGHSALSFLQVNYVLKRSLMYLYFLHLTITVLSAELWACVQFPQLFLNSEWLCSFCDDHHLSCSHTWLPESHLCLCHCYSPCRPSLVFHSHCWGAPLVVPVDHQRTDHTHLRQPPWRSQPCQLRKQNWMRQVISHMENYVNSHKHAIYAKYMQTNTKKGKYTLTLKSFKFKNAVMHETQCTLYTWHFEAAIKVKAW